MNRQVPLCKYLIVGNGRLAKHLHAYLSFLNMETDVWHRVLGPIALSQSASAADKILICINDDNLHSFILDNALPRKKCVHFSGSVQTPLAERLHPLFSFTNATYSLIDYKSIPFIGELGGDDLSDIFPQFENPFFQIPKDQFPLYHALCVLSGNGMTALWSFVLEKFESELGLPLDLLKPFAQKTLENIFIDPKTALSGPWARGDRNTIQKNLHSIKDLNYRDVYEALAKTQIREDMLSVEKKPSDSSITHLISENQKLTSSMIKGELL